MKRLLLTLALILLAVGGVAGIAAYHLSQVSIEKHQQAVAQADHLLLMRRVARLRLTAELLHHAKQKQIDAAQNDLVQIELAIDALPRDATAEAQRARLQRETEDSFLRQ